MGTGHILGEGAAIFTDMTETMLTALDQQMALSDTAQKPKGPSLSKFTTPKQISSHNDIRSREGRTMPMSITREEDKYPDLYLPVTENYKISDKFCRYADNMSADNNPMILMELTGLSYRYGTTIYAVDRVNGTMYDKFSGGFRIINERVTKEPQYRGASLAGIYGPAQPMHMSTLLGMAQMVTPLAESTPMTQSLPVPAIPGRIPHVRDILEPTSNEQARSNYLENQMRQMGSISRLQSSMPSLEDELVQKPDSVRDMVKGFCWENKVKRKQEWESHRMALEKMKESKGHQQQQQSQEE